MRRESTEQMEKAAEDACIANQKLSFLTNCVNPLIRLLTRLAHVVIAIIAGHAMLTGRLSVGIVQAFFQYINQTAEPLTEASYMINSLQAAFASARRTFELLDEEEEVPDHLLMKKYCIWKAGRHQGGDRSCGESSKSGLFYPNHAPGL